MVTLFGNKLEVRGCNKKYTELDDLDQLYTKLLTVSMGELAKELGVPYNSIRHRVHKYFTPEMIDRIKRQRKFHSKIKREQ